MKINETEIEKKAISGVWRIWKEFLFPLGGLPRIGIIGGTVKKAKGTVIRTSDKCLISRKGDCYIHRHPALVPNSVIEYDLGYQLNPLEIEEILGNVVYASSLCVANPIVRFLMYEINLEEINKVTLKEANRKPRWPVVNSVLPGTSPRMYLIPLEEFRKREKRPNWCLKLAKPDYPYFAPSKDGFYQRVSEEMIKRYLRYWISVAHGLEWSVDYAILARVPNPVNPNGTIIVCGGSHELGTRGANALISLTREIPKKKIVFRNIFNSMAWLNEVLEREKIEHFQAILRVTDDIMPGGQREINVYCQGVFNLNP